MYSRIIIQTLNGQSILWSFQNIIWNLYWIYLVKTLDYF